jgi:DNA-binding transcriptional regulator GbsR (MarR family)
MSDSRPPIEPADDPMLIVADVVGGLMEFWGFKRHLGRMWTLLYLEPSPLHAGDIAERLSMSTGAVSMTLSELTKWGVVKKAWIPGERRDYYEPETNIWKMVSRVFRERELVQIQAAIESFERATAELGANDTPTPRADDDAARRAFAVERIERLLHLARLGETLLSGILAGEAVDASPLQLFRLKPES